MGWTAYYQLLRERPLDDRELAALDDFIARVNQPPWECESFRLAVTRDARADHVLGYGFTKLPMELDESEDHERLCAALNALPDVIAGVEVRISDDFQTFGWESGKVALGGRRGPALVNVKNTADFVAPDKLAPPRATPLAPELAALLGGKPARREALGSALVAFAQLKADHPEREVIANAFASAPPLELALAGFHRYREVRPARHAWGLVTKAMQSLSDVTPLVPAFLDVWRNPHGIYWYGDMDIPRRDELARVPEIEAQLQSDVAASVAGSDSELVHRRAEHAAEMLGRAGSVTALVSLIEAARALRDGSMSSDQRYHTNPGVHKGLALAAIAPIVPTLLLDLGTCEKLWRHHLDALPVLARLAPARVLPMLQRLARDFEALYEVIAALEIAGDKATLRTLCAAPSAADRDLAAKALRALREEPPRVDDVSAPDTLLFHPLESVRKHARSQLERTMDPAYLTAVVASLALESAIGRRTGGASGSYGEYLQLLPEELRFKPHAQQLDALRAEIPGLPAQRINASVREILDRDLDALAASYVTKPPTLDPAIKAAIIDEEARVLAALRRGSLDVDVASGPPLA